MNTLEHIIEKYNIDTSKPSPFELKIGRYRCIPRLFRELGFKVGAEVGVYKATYTCSLLKHIPGLKLYGIDAWEDYLEYPDFKSYKTGSLDIAYEVAKKNVKGLNCELIRGRSIDVAKRFEDESLDFVFIDANHIYEYVIEDIAAWSKKVRKGGIVYGHDFNDLSDTDQWHIISVRPAVEGWTKAHKIHPWFYTTNNKMHCWMYVK